MRYKLEHTEEGAMHRLPYRVTRTKDGMIWPVPVDEVPELFACQTDWDFNVLFNRKTLVIKLQYEAMMRGEDVNDAPDNVINPNFGGTDTSTGFNARGRSEWRL